MREGKPTPAVSWLVNGRETEGRLVENVGQNVVVSKLTVPQLRREHRNATYKCRAANTHLIPPLEKTVILDIYRECSHRPPRKGNPPRRFEGNPRGMASTRG